MEIKTIIYLRNEQTFIVSQDILTVKFNVDDARQEERSWIEFNLREGEILLIDPHEIVALKVLEHVTHEVRRSRRSREQPTLRAEVNREWDERDNEPEDSLPDSLVGRIWNESGTEPAEDQPTIMRSTDSTNRHTDPIVRILESTLFESESLPESLPETAYDSFEEVIADTYE